jgi:hypothetical protein
LVLALALGVWQAERSVHASLAGSVAI